MPIRQIVLIQTLSISLVLGQSLTQVQVQGPANVVEGGNAQFVATAYFSDGSTQDVTLVSTWAVEPASAGTFAQPGLLTAGTLANCSQLAQIKASYSQASQSVTGSLDAVIRDTSHAGSALQFDGVNDYVSIPDSSALHFGQQVTLEFWIWVQEFPPGPSGYWLLTKSAGGPINFGIGPQGNSIVASYRVAPDQGSTVGVGGAPMDPQQWVHIASVLDTTAPSVRFYVNGLLSSETSTYGDGTPIPANPLLNNAEPFLIAGLPPFTTNMFPGRLDELRIWNIARTTQEIQASMFSQLSGAESGLVGYWRFDEGTGSVSADLSSHGNNAFLGSNPNGTDSADPTWVSSTAPIDNAQLAVTLNSQPQAQAVCQGALASFSVLASGSGPISYQWRHNGMALSDGGSIAGSATANLTLGPVLSSDAGKYDVIVSNPCGSMTSNAAVLTVNTATSIQAGPTSQTACTGISVVFSVVPAGTGPFSYQWRKGGIAIGGANGSALLVGPLKPMNGGSYDVVVTGACGNATTAPATLTVKQVVGDLDYDGSVNLADLSILLSGYGHSNGVTYEQGDVNGDGAIDLVDLALMLSAYGSVCH